MLTGKKNLAMTSQKPGKTQLINHFFINKQWYLVDLPGYGYAQRGKEGRENIGRIIESYIRKREQLTNLFVLIDCRHEPLDIDLSFMEWLGNNGVPFSIIFTKTDKLGKNKLIDNIRNYKEKLMEVWEELPPIFLTSSFSITGREEVLNYIASIINDLKKQ